MRLPTVTNTNPKGARDLPVSANDDALRARLLKSPRGLITKCSENLEDILRHSEELHGNVRFNELTLRVELTGERFQRESQKLPELLHVGITNWLGARWGFEPSASELRKQMLAIAREHSYNPPAVYLRSLHWDGTPRLDNWLAAYCKAEDTPYNRKAGMVFMFSAIARALTPGCEVDSMLILKGRQGCRKSTVVKVLGDPWSSVMPIGFGGVEARLGATRAWIVELEGVSCLLKLRQTAFKAFLQQPSDALRPMYSSAVEVVPRPCVFVGTTSEDPEPEDFDSRGRFWA